MNGDAIYGTRAWTKASDGDFRFTTKGKTLYAIDKKWPVDNVAFIPTLASNAGKVKSISMLGHQGTLQFTQNEEGLKVTFPSEKPCEFAYSLKIERE